MNALDSPLLERAMEAIQDPFFVFTSEGEILSWNRDFEEATGYREELASMTPIDLVPPQDTDQVKQQVQKVLDEGRVQFKAHVRTKEGRLIPSAFTGTSYKQNGRTLIFSTVRPTSSINTQSAADSEEATQKKNRHLRLVQEITGACNEAETLEEALRSAVEAVCKHTDWQIGHAFIPEETPIESSSEELTLQLTSTAIWNEERRGRFETFREATERTTFAPGEGFTGTVFARSESAWIEDTSRDPRFLRSEAAKESGLKGGVAFPVPTDEDVAAVLEFFSEDVMTPDPELLEIMESVGQQIGRVAEREKALKRLRSSVEQFRSLKESTVDGIVIANSKGRIINWNLGAEEIFGYDREEILGQPIEVLMPERHKEPHRTGIERVNRTGESRYQNETVETEGLRRNGEEFPLEISFSTWEIDGERCFSAIIRDITDRRQREKELRESERRYRRLFEDALDGIAITTPEGRVVDVNPAAEEIFGYSREELRAMSVTELYANPEDRKEIATELRENGAISGREVRFRRKDGEHIICKVSGTVQEAENGSPELWQGHFRDITERKRTEKALRESEETFRLLAENALVGIALIQDGRYRYVNPALLEITGYSRGELLGEPLRQVVHPNDWPHVQKQIEKRTTGEAKEVRYEARIRTKMGETRYIEASGTRITYQGEPAVIGTIQDVTEQRRLQREMLRIQEKERRRLGQDLHDSLASQLTAANIKLGLLSHKGPSEETDAIAEIQTLIEEGAGEVRRLSRGLSPAGLPEGDLLSALEALAENTEGAQFTSESHPNGEELSVETFELNAEMATHLYRIAQEAVNNARKYAEATEIVIRLDRVDDTVALIVEDDGIGFDPEEISEEGLGLRSMRHRAELLGAEFTVDAAPGEGTRIHCRLPA